MKRRNNSTVPQNPQFPYLKYERTHSYTHTHKHTFTSTRDTETETSLQRKYPTQIKSANTKANCLMFSEPENLFRFSLSDAPVRLLCPFPHKVEKLRQINTPTFQQSNEDKELDFCPSRSRQSDSLCIWPLILNSAPLPRQFCGSLTIMNHLTSA